MGGDWVEIAKSQAFVPQRSFWSLSRPAQHLACPPHPGYLPAARNVVLLSSSSSWPWDLVGGGEGGLGRFREFQLGPCSSRLGAAGEEKESVGFSFSRAIFPKGQTKQHGCMVSLVWPMRGKRHYRSFLSGKRACFFVCLHYLKVKIINWFNFLASWEGGIKWGRRA